ILKLAEVIAVLSFEEDANEAVKEVQVLGRGIEAERIDTHVLLTQAELHVPSMKKCRQLAVAVAKIQYHAERVVLLRVRHKEVQEEALPAPGGTQGKGVPDILDVQVIGERCLMRRLERCQCRLQQL